MKTIQTKVKPINFDIHFEYLCPVCSSTRHWLSLNECKEKNFKVVCDCGGVFKPKRIKNIDIEYVTKPKLETKTDKPDLTEQPSKSQQIEDLPIPSDLDFDLDELINDCIVTLCGFGFEKEEARDILIDSYNKSPTKNSTQLVKQTLLDNFGVIK
jgi:hypothetical protein